MHATKGWLRLLALAGVLVTLATFALSITPAFAASQAQAGACGAARIIIEGGRPTPYALPDNADTTLDVDPDSVLTLRAENAPPALAVRWSVAGLGGAGDATRAIGGSGSTTIDLADYSKYGHGLYDLDLALLSGSAEVCSLSLRVRITGFGGVAGVASVAAAGGTAAVSLLSSVYTANGAKAKLNARIAVRRRRPTGWRRWVPVPAWKRTIIGTIIGAITGLSVTAALQQGGVAPLSLATAAWGLVTGGAMALGAGFTLGAILTYLRPPLGPAAEPMAIPTASGSAVRKAVASGQNVAERAAVAMEKVQASPVRMGKKALRALFRRK